MPEDEREVVPIEESFGMEQKDITLDIIEF
jgi:hypothetical protein